MTFKRAELKVKAASKSVIGKLTASLRNSKETRVLELTLLFLVLLGHSKSDFLPFSHS